VISAVDENRFAGDEARGVMSENEKIEAAALASFVSKADGLRRAWLRSPYYNERHNRARDLSGAWQRRTRLPSV
jgi:hypothetical protein